MENSTHPSLPYSAIMRSNLAVWASFRETSSTSEGKHVKSQTRCYHPYINRFAHYLWDIYEGFGHNGWRIQHTLPSHTQPSCDQNWLPGPLFEKLHPLRKGNMCVKFSDTVLPPITGLHITFGTYMKALGTMGR